MKVTWETFLRITWYLQVPYALISKLAREEDIAKFERYSKRSFIDDNPRASWCPGAGCGRAAVCAENLHSTEMMDVYCECGTASCFRCHEEAHRPVSASPAFPG